MHEKLVELQSELKAPKNQKNTFGNYNYRSCEDILEALKPLLKKHGLTIYLSDEVVNIGTHNYIKATAAITDGDTKVSVDSYAREAEEKKGMDAAQITGAASSYARKYALNGLLAIDDTKDADGQDNSKPAPKKADVKVPAMPPTNDGKVRSSQLKQLDDLLESKGIEKDKRRVVIEGIIGQGKSARDLTFLEAVKLIDDIKASSEHTLANLANGEPF